jgi:hypothetical protein
MKKIELREVDRAFREYPVDNIEVVRRDMKCWYFTFQVTDPVTGNPATCTLETQRGELRCWADPRSLFQFLSERYGVNAGTFSLKDEIHEKA